ncbi:pili assembly chaperone [Kosakonia radicincitans UMEnt01/12]|nr:pili assembly chaperone [Kosakonia radicincitans UMEnt01/12]
MQRQTRALIIIVISWLILCASLSLMITGTGKLAGTTCILIILACTPFLLKGINRLQYYLNNRACIVHRHKNGRRLLIHLAPWQTTAKLPAERVNWFWDGLFEALSDALRKTEGSVVIASHLLTNRRAERIISTLSPEHYRCRFISVPFTPFARAVLQLETLFTQWHWVIVNRDIWPVLIIKKNCQRELIISDVVQQPESAE